MGSLNEDQVRELLEAVMTICLTAGPVIISHLNGQADLPTWAKPTLQDTARLSDVDQALQRLRKIKQIMESES